MLHVDRKKYVNHLLGYAKNFKQIKQSKRRKEKSEVKEAVQFAQETFEYDTLNIYF